MSDTVDTSYDNSAMDHEEEGYHKGLKPRQLQMIAIGGAIGTGLFLGAGGRLASAGPGLFLAYALCGIFVFFILRALGELVLHRPSSGSFVSYAREFFGEKAAFVAGWMYFLNWAMTAIVDVTAIATYMHYWGSFEVIPQWAIALVALVLVMSLNLVSVKWFGEMEFWAAMIKVIALVTFLIVGIVFLAGRIPVGSEMPGISLITDNGGLFPSGAWPLVIVISGVVFAYAAVELVGTAAGETENPEKIMPRAINSVIARIALFYVGSLVLLALLLPYTAYQAGTSPFVTFFSSIGLGGAGTIMNIVVLTAALSSLNAGLYSTGRILRSMAMNGSAPEFTKKMTKGGTVRRHSSDLLHHPVRCRPQRHRARRGLRDRAEHVRTGHHRQLGDHRAVPDSAVPLVQEGHPEAAQVPTVRCAVHELRDAGVPVRRAGPDGLRCPDRLVDHRDPRRHHPRTDRRLVPGAHQGALGGRRTNGLHRPVPGGGQPSDRTGGVTLPNPLSSQGPASTRCGALLMESRKPEPSRAGER